MALEEKTSIHLGVPYVYLPDQKKFLCQNGVLFSLEEYRKGIDINAEYKRREKEDKLYDYAYAKSTGLLRKKRGFGFKDNPALLSKEAEESNQINQPAKAREVERVSDLPEADNKQLTNRASESSSDLSTESRSNQRSDTDERRGSNPDQPKNGGKPYSGLLICTLLFFTAIISGYISTLHTATYLYDYVDIVSAWLMSASVTAYNATAFEVAVIFKSKRRFGLTFVFITLWGMVTP